MREFNSIDAGLNISAGGMIDRILWYIRVIIGFIKSRIIKKEWKGVNHMGSLADLEYVNSMVNKGVTYKTDDEQFGRAEFWCIAEKIGDCEDYALAKLHKLLDLGWPIEALRLCTCWCENDLGYHAVLIVEIGSEKYVLDNRFENVYNLNFDNGYKYDKIQAIGGSKTWLEMSQ